MYYILSLFEAHHLRIHPLLKEKERYHDRHYFIKQLSSAEAITIVYIYNNCIYVPIVLKYISQIRRRIWLPFQTAKIKYCVKNEVKKFLRVNQLDNLINEKISGCNLYSNLPHQVVHLEMYVHYPIIIIVTKKKCNQ